MVLSHLSPPTLKNKSEPPSLSHLIHRQLRLYIRDPNLPSTTVTPSGNTRGNLCDLTVRDFLDRTQKALTVKRTTDKLEFIQIKTCALPRTTLWKAQD